MAERYVELRSHRDAWTRAFGPAPRARETVIVVPAGAALDRGFARARAAAGRGTVRLVGRGVTIRRERPAWVDGVAWPLLLSELDGYTPREKGPILAALEPSIHGWLDALLDGALPGVAASRVFFTTAMMRFLQDATEAWLAARGLDQLHAGDRLLVTEPGSTLDRMLAARRSPSAVAAARRPGVRDAAAAALFAVAGAARRIRDFAAEAPSRRRLRRARAGNPSSAPRVWIGAIGHWPRMSRPTLEAVPPLARQTGERLGVLLQATLKTGLQHGVAGEVARAPVLPVLDAPELDGVVAAVEQGVSVESAVELARVIGRSIATSLRAVVRARRAQLILDDGEARCALTPDVGPLARLITVDVLRACEAHAAAAALTARVDLSRSTLVWPHCSGVADLTTDAVLRRAGASTIELMHGLSEVGYALRTGHTNATVKVLWSIPEAEDLQPFRPGQRCVGGFMPRSTPAPVARRPLARDQPIPVLVASSYLVSAYGDNPRLYEPYMEPLLEAALAAQAHEARLVLRWRPHPGDDARLVAALRRAYPQLEASTGSLDDDLRWCRVMVSCISSVTLEALAYDVPIFVHDIPRWDDTTLRLFDRRRLFGREHALDELLAPCVAELRSGAPDVLAPEHALKRTLFGAAGAPRSLAPLLYAPAEPIADLKRSAR